MDCFYIITNRLKDRDFAVTNEIRRYIEKHGKKCILSEKDEEGHILPGTVPEEADCALVLGGDGTLIRAVRDLGDSNLPLLGINLGTLGAVPSCDDHGLFPVTGSLLSENFCFPGTEDQVYRKIVLK